MYKYDYAVYVGRFQPFHNGHLFSLKEAAKVSEKIIIVLGSINIPRNIKNPFTFEERKQYIIKILEKNNIDNFIITGIEDSYYQDNLWVSRTQERVDEIINLPWSDKPKEKSICIVGFDKDESSFYLRNFKNWEFLNVGEYKENKNSKKVLSSSNIRKFLFSYEPHWISSVVPDEMETWLNENFINEDAPKHEDYQKLCSEYQFLVEYEKQFDNFPYSVNFLTCDAVVEQSGHVLLIKRGAQPGKGLWALPGGHVDAKETTYNACVRELKEESKLNFAPSTFYACLRGEKFFDHPERSLRGRIENKKCRTATMVYHFVLDGTKPLPKVKGSSDAEHAKWFKFSEIKKMKNQIFEDHHDIINYFIF